MPLNRDDDAIEAEYVAQMNAIAKAIDDTLNGEDCPKDKKKTGFVLLVFPFGQVDGTRLNYISNGERGDVLASMREVIARSEGRYHKK